MSNIYKKSPWKQITWLMFMLRSKVNESWKLKERLVKMMALEAEGERGTGVGAGDCSSAKVLRESPSNLIWIRNCVHATLSCFILAHTRPDFSGHSSVTSTKEKGFTQQTPNSF